MQTGQTLYSIHSQASLQWTHAFLGSAILFINHVPVAAAADRWHEGPPPCKDTDCWAVFIFYDKMRYVA